MSLSPIQLYTILLKCFGTQHWWPVDSLYHKNQGSDPRFEIVIGALLTQNTAWGNVEKALDNLKGQHVLSLEKIMDLSDEHLKQLIRPAGFFNQKAQRVKNLCRFLNNNYHRNLDAFFDRNFSDVRRDLLSLSGIGPETADSILLYAAHHPVFVVDAYTCRIAGRLPFNVADTYEDVQQFFEQELKKSCSEDDLVCVYREFHALLVTLAKQYCKKNKPVCIQCPVKSYCSVSEGF